MPMSATKTLNLGVMSSAHLRYIVNTSRGHVQRAMGKSLGLIIFPDFETLDVYGPIGLIGTNMVASDYLYDVTLISSTSTEILTPTSNIPTLASLTIDRAIAKRWDVVLLPGGIGFERLVTDPVFLVKLRQLAHQSEIVFTVCTGSFTLAATGLLDGVKATSNKQLYWEWTPKFPKVDWVPVARWTHDGKYLCSSGVSAGMVTFLWFI
jgi:transcriptional regulator GlxA family with amidase domain